jgi:hypothetical protein
MRITFKTFNTLPTKRDPFWQIVLIPTVTVLNSFNKEDKYIVVNTEWLFWSLTTIFEHDYKR